MKTKLLNFIKRIGAYVKHLFINWRTTLPAFVIAELIFWLPVWLPTLLYFILKVEWLLAITTAAIAFWAGPLTPAIALQLGLIALIERWFNKKYN
jgi:hypothetical protein